MSQETIQITKDQAEKYLSLMQYAEYCLLNEEHEKMLDYRLSGIELQKLIDRSQGAKK